MSSDIQGNNIKVEIQSKKWIKPATPTPFHLQMLKISYIDQLVANLFIQPVFYFENSGSETDQVPGRLLHLEESLSKVLTLYYPFAGRGDEDDQTLVSCQDQGVAFVVAKVDTKLDQLAYDGEYDTQALLSGLKSLQTSNLLVLVQVNIFLCGGLAIGLRVSHKVGDMFTISSFMNAWATTCRLGNLDKVVRPSFSFSSFLPSRSDFNLPNLWISDDSPPPEFNTAAPTPKYVIKRFIFTGEAIAKIRSSIPESYTRVELVIAIITKSLTNIEKPKHNKTLVIGQPMNFRSRTRLPIEDNSCGNLFTLVTTICGQLDNGLLSWEITELAKLIKNSINDVASEMRELRDWTELGAAVVKASLKLEEQVKKGESVHVVTFTSWCRFSLYEVDFGWGRPTLVRTVPIIAANCTFLMDCKSDIGGVEALVCLEEQEMALFQQQSDILEYALF